MARLFFRLRLAPDDEADDVRQMLDEHSIDWFETSAGRWGISFPAIWLRENEDMEQATTLLAAYQRDRTERQRQSQREREERGEAETMVSRFYNRPLQSVAALLIIGVIVYFSVKPFFHLAGD